MSVTYATAVKTDRMQATANHLASGTLEIQAVDDTVLAIFSLAADQSAAVSGAVWTIALSSGTVTGEVGAGAGTDATKAQIKDSGAAAKITGLTVSTSGADINFDNVNIASGQNVTLSSATITHA